MKEFRNTMETIARRWSIGTVFDDFLTMAVCAFTRGQMEDLYNETAKRYDAEEVKLFGQALSQMVKAYEQGTASDGSWCDVLGTYFEEVNSSATASHNGQFFTPVALCDMMAKMVGNQNLEPLTVNDPTCGSSRSLIAHARLHPDNRLTTRYIGQDMDARCVKMSVLNFVMYGMKGYVIHCDTLRMEVFSGYRIYLPETGLLVYRMSAEEAKSVLVSAKKEKNIETEKVLNVGKHGQISLF